MQCNKFTDAVDDVDELVANVLDNKVGRGTLNIFFANIRRSDLFKRRLNPPFEKFSSQIHPFPSFPKDSARIPADRGPQRRLLRF